MTLLALIKSDIQAKSLWCYRSVSRRNLFKTLCTDGTTAMVLYRLMQWSRKHGLVPMVWIFNKLNAIGCRCIIGRGAEFGPGFVLIHSQGTVINSAVRGGNNIHLEHQVTLGAEKGRCPLLQDNIFIGAGAKVLGGVTIGYGAKIGANAVVLQDVQPCSTAVGVPARILVRPFDPSPNEAARSLPQFSVDLSAQSSGDPP